MKTEGFVLIIGLSRVLYYYSGRSQKRLNIALIAEVGVDTTIYFLRRRRGVSKKNEKRKKRQDGRKKQSRRA